MNGLLATTRAELLEFKTIRRIAAVLRRDVVTLLAHGACQRDARTNIRALCHFSTPIVVARRKFRHCSEGVTRTLDLTIMSRTL